MGCWNETCGFSQHSILSGEQVYGIVILGNPRSTKSCYADGIAKPMSMMIEGIYNDYGSIESIESSFSASMLIRTMNELYISKKLIMSEQALEDVTSNLNSNYGVTGFTEEEGFTDCETIFYFIERGYLHISDHDYNAELKIYPIFFMMFKKGILDIAIDSLNTNNDYSYKDLTHNIVKDDVNMLYSEIFDNMDTGSMIELEAILEDENTPKDKLEEAQKIYYRMLKNSFDPWGGDSLKSNHSKWGNKLNILRSLDFVSTNAFRIIYSHLNTNHYNYDREEVITDISNFIMLLHTFDLFRKIWTPQGHSSQTDNFDIELKFIEKLLRYMYEQRKERLENGWYDSDDEEYIDAIGGISIIKSENEEIK